MSDLRYSGAALVTTVCVLGGFTLAVFTLRLWFRTTRRKFDASDTALVAAVVCGITQSVIYLILVFAFDYGKRIVNIPLQKQTSHWPNKLLYANQIVFKLTTPLCKLSLCLLYRAMCATSTGRLIERTRIAIRCTIVFIVSVYTSALLVTIFQCHPIQKIWMYKVPGSCIDINHFRYSTQIFNMLTSLTIITLPIPVLMKLKQRRPEVKQLIGLILLGLMHTSLTIARLVVIFYPDPLTKSEPQYAWIPGYCLAVGEMDANILFASLVVMRPAFQALYHAIIPPRKSGAKGSDSSRTDSAVDSAVGRFREALEKRQKKRISEAYILAATELCIEECDGNTKSEIQAWAKEICREVKSSSGSDPASQMERGEASKANN